jgi:putative inorganic carbon (HCO3(-)) transporter
MNIPYVALRNLKRKVTRTWLLFSIVAVVSCTLFSATLFLKSINNALKIGTYRLGADLLVVPGVLWIILAVREGRRPDVPAFFWPLMALAAWTLVSCAFSSDPLESFGRSRQLMFFLIVPGVARLLRGDRAMTTLNVIVALGAAGALVGIVEYVALGYDQMNNRPKGTLGHYMTYSGVLMLVTCVAAARLIYYRREWIWPAIAVPALLVAQAFTESRNAWVGTALAVGLLLAVRQWKLLFLVPVVALLFAFAAPRIVTQRAVSMFDLQDATNRDRVAMIKSGIGMIRDHPLFGVGMNMVPKVYPNYRSPDAVDPAGAQGVQTRAHLHNVPVQLAAERGLPALAAWLWFVVVAGRDLYRQLRQGPAQAVAGAGAAALVAMLAAGMFEHNFGDSEFLALFLGIISLPYAAALGSAPRSAVPPASNSPHPTP